jgi:hypothetical protein
MVWFGKYVPYCVSCIVNVSFRFDIEGPGSYWSGSTANNRAFFEAMVAEAKRLGL